MWSPWCHHYTRTYLSLQLLAWEVRADYYNTLWGPGEWCHLETGQIFQTTAILYHLHSAGVRIWCSMGICVSPQWYLVYAVKDSSVKRCYLCDRLPICIPRLNHLSCWRTITQKAMHADIGEDTNKYMTSGLKNGSYFLSYWAGTRGPTGPRSARRGSVS